ncbi:unnamed protein product [Ilex paraguariensis]|uniref:Uncharacterized protein n=1 Tax=Ilex paraguariensis TaxID=185542 RepID=A0ABC8RLI1_9AQUA
MAYGIELGEGSERTTNVEPIFQVHGDEYEATNAEVKASQKLVKAKRQEIDSVQSMINKVKNAISIEGIDALILRKELDCLKDKVSKAEAAAVLGGGEKYEDESKRLKELQAQFRAADDILQQAYSHFLSLRA